MLALAIWAGRWSKSDSGSDGEGGITMRGLAVTFRDCVSNRLSKALRRWVVSLECMLLSAGGNDADSSLEAVPAYSVFPDSSSEVLWESRYVDERLKFDNWVAGSSDSCSSVWGMEAAIGLVIRNLGTDPVEDTDAISPSII